MADATEHVNDFLRSTQISNSVRGFGPFRLVHVDQTYSTAFALIVSFYFLKLQLGMEFPKVTHRGTY